MCPTGSTLDSSVSAPGSNPTARVAAHAERWLTQRQATSGVAAFHRARAVVVGGMPDLLWA